MDRIRVSSGSAITLKLIPGFLNAQPTTAYFLTYLKGKCTANCAFCPQARENKAKGDALSRVTWPDFLIDRAFIKLKDSVDRKEIKRVCIQALNYPEVFQDLFTILKKLESKEIDLPISVSCQPLNIAKMEKLRDAGVERLGVSLDAATKDIFDQVKGVHVKGPYNWEKHHKVLLDAVKIFGKEKVTTHLIVGLGEKEEDVVKVIQWCVDNGIILALFSFTPIPKTALEHKNPPEIDLYRRIQLARHLITKRQTRAANIKFIKGHIAHFGVSEKILEREIADGTPFRTSGCPNCNRPYYNEKPSGPIYNFPIQPGRKDIEEIKQQLQPMLSYKI